MASQRLRRLGHVRVAQVPRGDSATEHLAVIALGVLNEPRVLLGREELVRGDPTVAAGVVGGVSAQLDQLADDLLLA